MVDSVFFDLDGTINDSGPGIIRSLRYALDTMKRELPGVDLRTFVGPPLLERFQEEGLTLEETQEAIRLFRECYTSGAMYECELYPGMPELLAKLQEKGMKLYVATSKKEDTARHIVEHLGLAKYFVMTAGSDPQSGRESKSAVLKYLMEECDTGKAVMIGDTFYDVRGAKKLGLPCIGVSWGYGSVEAMQEEGALKVVDTAEELLEAILEC